MLRSVKELQQFSIHASDGPIGSADEFYFDDQGWTVRYLVVDTGKWLPGRRVLISPMLVRGMDWEAQTINLTITRDQVKGSPDIATHKPVSRQQELAQLTYYGLPPYWGGPFAWGAAPYALPPPPLPSQLAELDRLAADEKVRAEAQGDDRLRSTREVIGYALEAQDGDLGSVNDFLVEDATWTIRYIVINTGQWWFGRKVLIPPAWFASIDWASHTARSEVTRQQVKDAPPYDRASHLDRQWEADYFKHYAAAPYWDDETSQS